MTSAASEAGTAAPAERSPAEAQVKRRARPVPPVDHSMGGMQRTLRHVEQELQGRYPQADLTPVSAAFAFAHEAHAEQKRASGEPYVTHPLAVARILAEMGLDPVAVTAALLHDIPEDTEYSLGDIEEHFGADVARLVNGVTKLSKFSTLTHEQQQAENIRKMFLAMAEDIRVVLIKLADRLHNMRTLGALPPAKQQRIARQTAEIYAPLAERLGIWQIKGELEDLSFKIMDPDAYHEVAGQLESHRKGREVYVRRAMEELQAALAEAGIVAELSGRPKHIYSIYKKMRRKRAEFGEIYDVHALRVLVADVRECYAALGVVHALWRPIPGQFDDYIAMPKNNMYQSLHTAVVALDGKPLEVQIRSHDMHRVSEVGIAAHWRYKEGSRTDRAYDAKLAWVRQLMEWQTDVSDATEFIEGVKLDIFQDQVFVFTPKGDVKDMPAGATPLDFAYRIHTEVGHACIGSKVNNRLVPLDYTLKNGDIVDIVTTKSAHGPSRDWLNIVTTSHAREKIRQWFKRQQRDENITHGRQLLDRELRRLARTTLDRIDHAELEGIARPLRHEVARRFPGRHRLRPDQRPAGRLPAGRGGRRGTAPAAAGGTAAAHAGRGPRARRGRPAGPLQQVLPPHPGRSHRRLHHEGPWRHRAPGHVRHHRQRARRGAAHRRGVGDGRPAHLPDRHPHRGLRPHRAPGRHQHRRRGRQDQHRGCHGGGPQGPPRHGPGHAGGLLRGPALAGHGPSRATQGRLLGGARSRLTPGADHVLDSTPSRPVGW